MVFFSGIPAIDLPRPYQKTASLFCANLVIVPSLGVVSNMKSGEKELNALAFSAMLLGQRVATMEYLEAVISVESAGAHWLTTETMQLPPSVKFDPLVRTCVIKVHLDVAFRQQHRNSSLLLSEAAAMRDLIETMQDS